MVNFGLSRVFRRGPDQKGEGVNTRTLVHSDRLLTDDVDRGFDAKTLFFDRYETIRRALDAHRTQGVLILAFDRKGRALAQGWLKASLDKTRNAIIGRHTACGVALPSADRKVSLRHLAVLVRACSHSEATVRIVDLHTARGFTDESGQVLSAAVAEGPLFIGLDGVHLALLMTGEPPPDDPEEAYAAIPPRVLIEERRGTVGVDGQRKVEFPTIAGAEQTLVRSTEGPVAAVADLCRPDEAPVGTLVIRGAKNTIRRTVGADALARGILVGRYERCSVGMDTGRLSRVHFLLTQDEQDVIGVDTASTNGSWIGEREVSLTKLADGDCVSLAEALQLTWHEI